MATARQLNYIHYCLRENKHLESAKEKLVKLIKHDKNQDGRLYSLLADFTDNIQEKRICYEKAIEVDSLTPQAYWGLFGCDLQEENYEGAKQNLAIYTNTLTKKNMYCNTVLLNLLLDEILKIEDQEYYVDDYYNTVKLKGDKLDLYYSIFYLVQEEEYDKAYSMALKLDKNYDEMHMKYVLTLLDSISEKHKGQNPYQKLMAN